MIRKEKKQRYQERKKKEGSIFPTEEHHMVHSSTMRSRGWALFLCPDFSLGLSGKNNVRFRFSSGTKLILLGYSYIANGSISLTRDFANPVRVLDSCSKSQASFSTRFFFSIITQPNSSFGHGFAFLITSDASSIGCSNGFMGLFHCFNSSSAALTKESIIAVEFDTSLNLLLHDINGNHVALDINTIISPYTVNLGSYGMNMKRGKPMTAWIEYWSIEKTVRLWVSYSSVRPDEPILSVNIGLFKSFDELMYVGFSASNGQGMTLHLIQQWSFKTFGFQSPPFVDFSDNSVANSNNNNNGTCDIGPQTETRTRTGVELWLALGIEAAVFMFFTAVMAAVAWYLKRKKKFDIRKRELQHNVEDLVKSMTSRLSLSEIRSATGGFDSGKRIGEVGGGTVYKGVLTSGNTVAVKKFHELRETFSREMRAVITSSMHRNLLPLHGWCCEEDELLLVYDCMPKGSLHKLLYSSEPSEQLSWEHMFKIVLGVGSPRNSRDRHASTDLRHTFNELVNMGLQQLE